MKPQDYLDQLLSETNFLKVIQIRAKFCKEYPKDFEEYMKGFANLDKQPWASYCLTCKNWVNNKCIKNLKPLPLTKWSDRQEYFCSSWETKIIKP